MSMYQNDRLIESLTDCKAVFFDMDGTIVDSMWMWRNIDIEYLGRFGIPLPENLQKNIQNRRGCPEYLVQEAKLCLGQLALGYPQKPIIFKLRKAVHA